MTMEKTGSQHTDQDGVFNETLKRRRIAMACVPCRSRKARCDGLRPTCSYCTRNHHKCTYRPASQMIQVSQEYLLKLKEQAGTAQSPPCPAGDTPSSGSAVHTLSSSAISNNAEAYNGAEVALPPSLPPVVGQNLESNTLSGGNGISFESNRSFSQAENGIGSLTAQRQELRPPIRIEETIQHHNQRSSFSESVREHHGHGDREDYSRNPESLNEIGPDSFYGQASTLSFMHTVQTTILSQSSPDSQISQHIYSNEAREPPNLPASALFGAETYLPQRSVADDLVNCFFRNVHALYPFIHEPSFRIEYEQMWTSSKRQDNQWLAMLNVIFALGIHFAYDLEDKSEASDRLFRHAQKLVSFDHFADANLRTLQLLLYSGLYFQSTSRPNQSWNTIGLAIRVATSIGVHLDPQASKYNTIQRELRRRCWYGCLILDRVLALLFGRPSAMTDDYEVSLPSNIDDSFITEDGYLSVESNTKTKIAVFIHSVTFSKLMNDVLKALYSSQTRLGVASNQSNSPSNIPEFKDVIGLDQRLVEWYQNLPLYLRSEESDETGEFRRARNILLARFLNVRVLIHRPFAPLWQQSTTTDKPIYLASINNSLHALCLTVCESAATQLVRVISRNYYQGLSSAWWVDMSYLLTAATVLLVLEFQTEDITENVEIKTSITEAFDILRHMRHRSSMASSYVTMLEKAQEGLKYIKGLRKENLSSSQVEGNETMTQTELSILGDLTGTMNFDDLQRIQDGNGNAASTWSFYNLYSMPWEMAIDNPMLSFDV